MMNNENRRTYAAVVTGNALGKSKQKGTPSVTISLRTMYNTETPEVPERINLVANLWLTYKTTEKTIKVLQEVFGWKGTLIKDFNEPVLLGKKCNLVCEDEEYEGETRVKVIFINRAGGLRKMDSGELQALIEKVQPVVNDLVGAPPEVSVTGEGSGETIADAEFSEAEGSTLTEEFPEEGLPF